MQVLFSTAGVHPRNKFKRWREMLVERFGGVNQKRADDGPFEGTLETTKVGSVSITSVTQGPVWHQRQSLKHCDTTDSLMVALKLSGASKTLQDGRSAVQRPGDIVILSHRPALLETSEAGQSLMLELPRARLEGMLGPSSLYTSLTVGTDLASTALASNFLQQLIQVGHQLSADAAERMASIGVDLIMASLAERMAQEIPRPVHGTLVVQRAKAYIEAHLGDPTLDPPHLAAALGVSLRRLQELFHERGQHISDRIWERRLAVAAKRLNDPACLHLPIGTLAYDCGFASQSHFSRRFKDRYGLTPREYQNATSLRRPSSI